MIPACFWHAGRMLISAPEYLLCFSFVRLTDTVLISDITCPPLCFFPFFSILPALCRWVCVFFFFVFCRHCEFAPIVIKKKKKKNQSKNCFFSYSLRNYPIPRRFLSHWSKVDERLPSGKKKMGIRLISIRLKIFKAIFSSSFSLLSIYYKDKISFQRVLSFPSIFLSVYLD